MTIAALKTDLDHRFDAGGAERRHGDRQPIGRTGVLRLDDGSMTTITIADLTREGCRILSPLARSIGETLVIGIAGVGQVDAEIVWRDGSEHGCSFAVPLAPGSVTSAMSSNIYTFADGMPVMPAPAAETHAKDTPRRRILMLALLSACAWAPPIALFYAVR